ncbi:MAG: hypothetical protein MUE52_18650 [Tabrizicola sp.]|jgi:hypothetical protein|nr:hypothetical protein [Tabrizicola sp.]
MIRVVPLCLALIATPALAQEFSEEQKAAFIDAIAANDCSMTETEAEVLLPAVGIDRDLSAEIAVYLLDRGEATLSEDSQTFTLAPELCQ